MATDMPPKPFSVSEQLGMEINALTKYIYDVSLIHGCYY